MSNTNNLQASIAQIKTALKANAQFMKHEDGYLESDAFLHSTIEKLSSMQMTSAQVTSELLSMNGCS